MNWILRITAVVVIVGMAASLPGVQAFALAPAGHAEGCHNHTPTPLSPVSYQCCANGHNWAIAGAPVTVPGPVAVYAARVHQDLQLMDSSQAPELQFLSSSPPTTSPLRI